MSDLAISLKAASGLAQRLIETVCRHSPKDKDRGGAQLMCELADELNNPVCEDCYWLAVELMHLRNCSTRQYQAALELLRLCPILRNMKTSIGKLQVLERQGKSGHVDVMEANRHVKETLLSVRIALQMAGKRVRLKDLYLV
jgi:hypothetical protein